MSGFQASCLYPLDRHQVLKHLPILLTSDEIDNAVFNESVLQILKENCRVGIEKKCAQTKRGWKITPGKKKTENENIWQCRDCADEWDEDGDMTNG